MNDASKKCPKCGETKPLTEFGKNKNAQDSLNCWCKICARESSRAYYYTHLDTVRAKAREKQSKYYAANRQRVIAYNYLFRELQS